MSLAIEKEPKQRASWPPNREEDALFRSPQSYPLDGARTESLTTIATKFSVTPRDLIKYNFRTSDPKEINWYLGHFVKCKSVRNGYYTFAEFETPPGPLGKQIFIPRFGEPGDDHVNRLGNRVVSDYGNSKRKEPDGRCYDVCYSRLHGASSQSDGATVPSRKDDPVFAALFGSLIESKHWKDTPEEYRGKGAPGALTWKGMGTLVESTDIWAGKLKPGAAMQTWKDASDYDRVKKGEKPRNYGHSFLFLHYARKGEILSVSSSPTRAIKTNGFWNKATMATGLALI